MKIILLIENYDSLRKLYSKVLSEAGYKVYSARTLKEVPESNPIADLIIWEPAAESNLSPEILDRFSSISKNPPLVINTGRTDYKTHSLTKDAYAVVDKSSNVVALLSTVEKALENKF